MTPSQNGGLGNRFPNLMAQKALKKGLGGLEYFLLGCFKYTIENAI